MNHKKVSSIEVVMVGKPSQGPTSSSSHYYSINAAGSLVPHSQADVNNEFATEVTVTTMEDPNMLKMIAQDHSYSKSHTAGFFASIETGSLREKPQQLMSLIKDPRQLQALAAIKDVDQKYFENIGKEPGFEIKRGVTKQKTLFSETEAQRSQIPMRQSRPLDPEARGLDALRLALSAHEFSGGELDESGLLDNSGELTDPYAHEDLPLSAPSWEARRERRRSFDKEKKRAHRRALKKMKKKKKQKKDGSKERQREKSIDGRKKRDKSEKLEIGKSFKVTKHHKVAKQHRAAKETDIDKKRERYQKEKAKSESNKGFKFNGETLRKRRRASVDESEKEQDEPTRKKKAVRTSTKIQRELRSINDELATIKAASNNDASNRSKGVRKKSPSFNSEPTSTLSSSKIVKGDLEQRESFDTVVEQRNRVKTTLVSGSRLDSPVSGRSTRQSTCQNNPVKSQMVETRSRAQSGRSRLTRSKAVALSASKKTLRR